jgi:hypothetical protein
MSAGNCLARRHTEPLPVLLLLLCRINTTNSRNGWSQWPYSSSEYYWNSQVIKGKHAQAKNTQPEQPECRIEGIN